jgi:hypothetical protein
MAPVIPFIGAILFGTAAGASAAYVLAVNLARFAILSLASKLAAPKIDLTESAANKMLTIRSTVQAQSFTYGQDMLSGPLIFANTTGDGNKELTRLVALHGREIDEILAFRIDDVTITIGVDIAGAAGAVTGGQYEDVMQIDSRLGTLTQTAIADLVARYSSLWTSGAHRARGWSLLYTRMTLESGNNAYQNGIPQNMRFLCNGHRVYDPRLDDTNGGTGPQRLADDTTWTFSDNPALCLSDFLRWETVGYSEIDERIDWPLCIIAADICDAQVDVPTPPALQKRYTCNFTFLSTVQREQVKEMLETSMMGRTVFSQGVWKMWAGAPLVADVTLTEANMTEGGSLQVQATSGSTERYNRVRGKHVDPSRNFTANAYPEQRNAAFEAADNGPKYQVFDVNTANTTFEAQRDAIFKLRQSRSQRIVVFPGNWSCFRIQPGTVVELTIAELGFNGELFFVTEWLLKTDGSGVQLTMIEESDWTDPIVPDYTVRSPTGELVFNLFGNCKLSGDSIHRTATGGACTSGYELGADGELRYFLSGGSKTTVGVPIDEWQISQIEFWSKTEQNSGDALEGSSAALGVVEKLDADREFTIVQGIPGSKQANLTTEIYLDAGGALVECEGTYDLKATVQAPIFLRSAGRVWEFHIDGDGDLPMPSPIVAGDDLFLLMWGLGLPEIDQHGVEWTLFSGFGPSAPFNPEGRWYRRVATADASDVPSITIGSTPRTMVGQVINVANDHGFFTPGIQSLVNWQGGFASVDNRGEFDTTWEMILNPGISLAEQTDPPDLATEAFNTWVFAVTIQARIPNPSFPATFSSFTGPSGVDSFNENYVANSGDTSICFGWGGRFYATSVMIPGEVLPYATTTGFCAQHNQYSRWRPTT